MSGRVGSGLAMARVRHNSIDFSSLLVSLNYLRDFDSLEVVVTLTARSGNCHCRPRTALCGEDDAQALDHRHSVAPAPSLLVLKRCRFPFHFQVAFALVRFATQIHLVTWAFGYTEALGHDRPDSSHFGLTLHLMHDATNVAAAINSRKFPRRDTGFVLEDLKALSTEVDIWDLNYMFLPLEQIGMNTMLIYVMVAEGIFVGFSNGWYIGFKNMFLSKFDIHDE
ncbi:hypothetical protein Dsin_023911 [Dipteronia sinensis]|uniref:Uncharacterized protein n=1 Tax=Dipteronia sinensis TaxID=43782 RepID=A0AAE0A5S4_9ROSI|nr:hypothetical protein Dsin_023911 [Dipteronia sinensis]